VTYKISYRILKSMAYIATILFLTGLNGCIGPQKTADHRLNGNYPKNTEETAQNVNHHRHIQQDHLKLARDLIRRGFFDVALVQLEKAEKENGGSAEIYFLTGKCNLENKNYAKAERKFQQSIRTDPDYAPAHNGLGLVSHMCEKKKKARECYKKAIRLNPARADFYNNLGFSEIMDKNYAEAKLHLLKSISLNSDFVRAKNNLALCHVMTGEDQKAFEILKKIFPLDIACHNMGALYLKKGNRKKANEMHKKAVELNPNLLETINNSDVNEPEAIESYEKNKTIYYPIRTN
jgi:tetratricopeptide (TPR) repeat protein